MAAPAARAHGHGHAEEELSLPHGSKWPIIAAAGIALFYFGVALGFPTKALGTAVFGLGALVTAFAAFEIIREDSTWWKDRVGTGARNGWWGVLFFLGTEVMLFAALFATYFNHRSYGGPGWDTAYHLPIDMSGVFTVILLLSGVTMHVAHSAIREGNLAKMKTWLLATIVLGAVFLAGQANEYLELAREGLIIQEGTFGSTFYLLTATHGAHVLGGLIALVFVAWRAFRGEFDQQRHVAVEVTAIYWHFVDVVWVLLFAIVYLRLF